MSRYPQDNIYRNGRSRQNGQQHGGRGGGYNAHHGQGEHVAIRQQSGQVQPVVHWRQQLNNYLQQRFRSTQDLELVDSSTGPGYERRWTVVVHFQGVEYGRGEGTTKASATEIACQIALAALRGPGIGH
ncbi:hypothetical protein DEU56DRAFT_906829 [Suillus clintonianus]|uniref:uncharacterized protein n=1 Tax=Suillus clintonianus TaxID=1904413 RepID=UPI001B86AC66|nr:uncharacterized protein DEU56DRAFT_906829 [Suillus clintonianus]KAG2155650.1 hypothetical protein DEU56DRAFT_906829 [Suillus clintonianus]